MHATGFYCEDCWPQSLWCILQTRSLGDIHTDVESLKSIEIGEQDYEILYYLGGDWKFLALATGIDSATSRYACIWCKCPMDEHENIDKKWSITTLS